MHYSRCATAVECIEIEKNFQLFVQLANLEQHSPNFEYISRLEDDDLDKIITFVVYTLFGEVCRFFEVTFSLYHMPGASVGWLAPFNWLATASSLMLAPASTSSRRLDSLALSSIRLCQ